MTSGNVPSKGEPGFDEVLAAPKEARDDNPRLAEVPEVEVARQIVLEGRLEEEPSPPLVAKAL